MKIFIGCSASNDIDNIYKEECQTLAHLLAQNHDLVFGGGEEGMTGILYETFKKNNRKIINCSVKAYANNFQTKGCLEAKTTNTVNERTDVLIKESDVILFLPGGVGTIYEFFSVLEEKRTNHIPQPMIIYDPWDYFNELKKLLERIYQESFTSREVSNLYQFITTKEELIKELEKIEKEEK